MVINHIDGNKTNNAITNLELVTSKENTQHAFKTGLKKALKGELNGNARINSDKVRSIIRDIIKGYSNKELSVKYKLDAKHISLIRNKKRWQFIFEEPEFKNYNVQKSSRINLNENEREQFFKDLKSELTNTQIAIKWNRNQSTISRLRKKYLQKTSTTISKESKTKQSEVVSIVTV